MADLPEVMLDAPIPGQSLTTEAGNRPWENPPQFATVEEALQHYIPRVLNPDLQEDMFNVLETGIPVTVIAEALIQGGTMQGKHTVDVGILVLPVLMETIAYLAEEQGVDYDMGTKLKTEDTPSSSAVALALKRVRDQQEALGEVEPTPETPPMEDEAMPTEEETMEMDMGTPQEGGLMSRRM